MVEKGRMYANEKPFNVAVRNRIKEHIESTEFREQYQKHLFQQLQSQEVLDKLIYSLNAHKPFLDSVGKISDERNKIRYWDLTVGFFKTMVIPIIVSIPTTVVTIWGTMYYTPNNTVPQQPNQEWSPSKDVADTRMPPPPPSRPQQNSKTPLKK